MKKIKITSLRLMLFLVIFVVALISSASVFAFEGERNDIQKITSELFEDAKIKSYEHLYGFNDAPDFIYVEFENSGYAIYLRDTLELLEFAPKGNLPFPTNGARKYYGGPANYFEKTGEQTFVSLDTNETFSISSVEAENYSRNLIDVFSKSIIDRTNVLEIVNPKEGSIEYDRNGKSMGWVKYRYYNLILAI